VKVPLKSIIEALGQDANHQEHHAQRLKQMGHSWPVGKRLSGVAERLPDAQSVGKEAVSVTRENVSASFAR
jgi:hypothetical protein